MYYVYFIQQAISKLIKIGFTKDLYSRFDSLQSASPFPLVLWLCFIVKNQREAKELEAFFQFKFRDHQVRGEWFDLNEEEARYLNDLEMIMLVTAEAVKLEPAWKVEINGLRNWSREQAHEFHKRVKRND